ncbi:hypothetical protein ID47_02990 [Candidatus Paracaedibacter acanthamoebae]|uniref:Uncharacterized protein n=2 Tax=Candidatus Odyssella acanthamoebae TaxID=91604 RepID=A0A077ARY6_9PROT|nr:hypothetical protein ID47_02990 [Candidatus Paracaedibacter acanthamoebae]
MMLMEIVGSITQVVLAVTLVYLSCLILKRIHTTEATLSDLHLKHNLQANLDNITFSNLAKRIAFLKKEILYLHSHISLVVSPPPKKRGRPRKEKANERKEG